MKSNEEIFTERFMPLYPRLYAVAASILGDVSDEAADAVQVALVKIWKSGEAMAGVANPEGYAVATVRTVAIDLLRRRHYSDSLDEAYDISSDTQPDPDADGFLEWIVSQLPERQQEVIRLSVFECLSNEEIAGITGLSAENVRQQLCRGRKKMKELYTKYMK